MAKESKRDSSKKIVKLGSRGRIVIPKKFRDKTNIQDKVLVIFDEKKGEIRIKPSAYKQLKLHELK